MSPARDQGEHDLMQVSEIKEQPEGETINQYTPIDEDEHKEVDRKANLNSARVFLYQGIGRVVYICFVVFATNHCVS